MTSLLKIHTPQPKNIFRVQIRTLAVSFETLTGSVAITGPEKFLRKATCDPVVLAREFLISAGRKNVNMFATSV